MSLTYKIEAQYHGEWCAEALHNQSYFVGNHQIGEIVENTHTKRRALVLDHKELVKVYIHVQVEQKHEEEVVYKQPQRDHLSERYF